MTEDTKSRAKYVPPRVMRLGEVRAGAGWCGSPGSGDITDCGTGNAAVERCISPGSNAGLTCWMEGSVPVGGCVAPGSGV